jgi:CRISPR-associated protein Csc1
MGILYETEKYLHNWGLSFALFSINYIPQVYRLQGENAQKPTYLDPNSERSLLHLNKLGIYVFPAQPLHWSYQINTFKAAQVSYYGKSKQFGDKGAEKNYPVNYGRAKELAVGSQYRIYIIAPDSIQIPHWIRLGKWAAKVKVDLLEIPETVLENKSGNYICSHPLNPLDLPSNQQVLLYNRIVMPPVSLVSQAQLNGEYLGTKKDDWQGFKSSFDHELNKNLPDEIKLPKGVFYGAGNLITTT